MTFERFLRLALDPTPGVRKGQHFANMLYHHRPDLSVGLQNAGLDPFYKDELLWAAVAYINEHWSES